MTTDTLNSRSKINTPGKKTWQTQEKQKKGGDPKIGGEEGRYMYVTVRNEPRESMRDKVRQDEDVSNAEGRQCYIM